MNNPNDFFRELVYENRSSTRVIRIRAQEENKQIKPRARWFL